MNRAKFVEECLAGRGKHPFAARAWKRFEEMGLPAKKAESYQYIQESKMLGSLASQDEVFVVGQDGGAEVLKLSAAQRKFSAFIDRRFSDVIKKGICPFLMLNLSGKVEGLFLYLPKHFKSEQSIEMEWHFGESYPKLMIFADKLAEADVVIRRKGSSPWSSSWCDVVLDEGARLSCRVFDEEGNEGHHLSAITSVLARDSNLKYCVYATGGEMKRYQFHSDILGSGAHCDFQELALLGKQEEFHVLSHIHHHEPHSTSNQLVKHLIGGKAKASFTGKIYIERKAQQTDAYQLNNNLLLTPDARAHSKPGLEIFADDVKASHGSTVASIDEEMLFYLYSRGLSAGTAKEFLVRAFASDMVGELERKEARHWQQKIDRLAHGG